MSADNWLPTRKYKTGEIDARVKLFVNDAFHKAKLCVDSILYVFMPVSLMRHV